jgi:hypothetical protein
LNKGSKWVVKNQKKEEAYEKKKRTYDVFEENISDEEEKKEEDLKLSLSNKGEYRINNSSQYRLVLSLDSPGHRCSFSPPKSD